MTRLFWPAPERNKDPVLASVLPAAGRVLELASGVVELAELAGLGLDERIEMPANNQTLVFR